mmetsp:Transcript_24160/g.52786  ORF Transcript_24160/g.52786 Transcript_24160/m.52786 type:complete len:210 (-) Transcript_24160:221-850(-)
MRPPATSMTSMWKPQVRKLRKRLRLAAAACSRCARLPNAAPRLPPADVEPVMLLLEGFVTLDRASSRVSRSDMRVAPSASMNSSSSPRAHCMPRLTACPLPRLLDTLSTLTASKPYFLTYSAATLRVLSLLPSSTTIISYVKWGPRRLRLRCKKLIASSRVAESRSSSLYAGTMIDSDFAGGSRIDGTFGGLRDSKSSKVTLMGCNSSC